MSNNPTSEKKSLKLEILEAGHLPSELRRDCILLTPPRYRCCLDGVDPDGIEDVRILLIAGFHNSTLAALAITGIYKIIGFAELFSFEIKQDYRTKEAASQVLQKLEEVAFSEVLTIHYFLRLTEPISPLLQKTLKDASWSSPELFMTRYFFDAIASHPDFYEYPLKLPEGCEIFPWKELKDHERDQLLKEHRHRHFSDIVSPFHEEEKIESLNSLGLRYKGEVIGWMITQRVAPDTLKYASFYVRPEFRYKGASMRLMIDSIKIQQKSNIKWFLIEVNYNSWGIIVDKRLKRYSLVIDEIYLTWKAKSPDVFKFPDKRRA